MNSESCPVRPTNSRLKRGRGRGTSQCSSPPGLQPSDRGFDTRGVSSQARRSTFFAFLFGSRGRRPGSVARVTPARSPSPHANSRFVGSRRHLFEAGTFVLTFFPFFVFLYPFSHSSPVLPFFFDTDAAWLPYV